MLRLVYIFLFSIVIACNNQKQNKDINADTSAILRVKDSTEKYLSNSFANADSIILITRRVKTREEFFADPMANDIPIVTDGQLNSKIITARTYIFGKSIDTLIQILSRSITIKTEATKCSGFNPHYSILISTKKQYFYIDLCLNCTKFKTSKDLSSLLFDDRKWTELERFFIQNGLNPNLPH